MNKVAVIGFGLTGRAVVDFLMKGKVDISVFDEKGSLESDGMKILQKKGVRFNFGPFNFSEIAKSKLIVMSPGISSFKFPEFKRLDGPGREVISEIELAFRSLKGRLICITGTNGKSTTTAMVHHILSAAGKRSYLLGNIGIPFIRDVENIGADEYAVVEVSCFQLEYVKRFKPDYIILTNISADHLDRYPSLESYIETRKRIFDNITPSDRVILNLDDPITKQYFPNLPTEDIWWFSRQSEVQRGVFLKDNALVFRSGEKEMPFLNLADFPLYGVHNIENAMAASLPPLLEGIEAGIIQRGLKDFRGLKHRLEFVTHFAGVNFINDSKATNVDATKSAIMSLNSNSNKAVIIMGGADKGGDFSSLMDALADRVKLIVLMGEATSKISDQLKGAAPIKKVDSMNRAVRIAFEEAIPEGVVILSPGCASFDMFDSFEERGEIFKEEVSRLKRSYELKT